MTMATVSSLPQRDDEDQHASYVRSLKSPGGILEMLEVSQPAGDLTRQSLPEIVLYEDMRGNGRVRSDLGGGRFDVNSGRGMLNLAAPNFAATTIMDGRHQVRCLTFPLAMWEDVLDEAADGQFSFDTAFNYGRVFESQPIRAALRNLWLLSEDEGAPSRLWMRAAGCEILAELCRLGGATFKPVKGGLSPWVERRCLQMMRERLAEDISLDDLAAEARLSPFHFARMFKQSVGVPPRVYLTQLRMEKACELLEHTDLPVTEIAQELGYSSNQVLARVFSKHQHMSPTDYRRAVQDPTRVARKYG
jgi:AraC family transcriptional regulator